MNAIDAIKTLDRNELLALIIRDDDAKKVLIAWTMIHAPVLPHKVEERKEWGGESIPNVITAAWAGIDRKKIPFEEMSILSGVPKTTVKLKWDQLRRAALIYPDGTANEKALATIRGGVAAHLRGIAKAS